MDNINDLIGDAAKQLMAQADGSLSGRRFSFLQKASAAASYPDVERRRETKGRQG